MKQTLVLIFLIAFNTNLFSQISEPSKIVAYRINSPITIDGILNEPAWQKANKISNFTQRELTEGAPATEKTEVAILYDENNLYIGFWGYDSEPDKIIALKMERDFRWGSEDNFEVIISPFDDNRNGYLFVINPNGAMADVLITDEGKGTNRSWNGIWDVQTTVNDSGWFAEIIIPFSTFKFPDSNNQVWAINFERNIRRKREQLLWQGWSRNYELEMISKAGKLVGLKNISAKNLFEFKPFVSGGVQKNKGGNWETKFKTGGDINYLISPTLKLNLTLNTDFSQVESDRAQINLTRFSLFYPEKREFFLEGKNTFEMNLGQGIRTFYSRRIGIHNGEEVPIIGGMRLLGRQNKTQIGLLSMQTSAKDTLPTTNYSVLRIKQDVLEQSNVGLIVTGKNSKDSYNYLYGLEANYATSKIFGDKNLRIGGVLSQTFTKNYTGKNPAAFRAYLSYPNDFVEYDLSVTSIPEDFNPEIGYVRRKDYILYSTELQFNPRPNISWIRRTEIKPADINYYVTKSTGEVESIQMEWRPLGISFTTGDFVEFNIQRMFDRVDESFPLVDTVYVPTGKYWDTRYELQYHTFSGRKFFTFGSISTGDFYTGKRFKLFTFLGVSINKHFRFSVTWNHNDISFPGTQFSTNEFGGRFTYSFNPKLLTSLFGQWNSKDEEIILNYRVNWIPKIGSYFYFVINQTISTANNKFTLENTTVLSKLIWFFTL